MVIVVEHFVELSILLGCSSWGRSALTRHCRFLSATSMIEPFTAQATLICFVLKGLRYVLSNLSLSTTRHLHGTTMRRLYHPIGARLNTSSLTTESQILRTVITG